ncbi:hypothetical protein GCM10010912_05460 [Paenibacillus albidus]|uniref:Uncharacterized protein n=1 Tax=Paenibacillus albidus TaxID=2041023 RepID=A0A917C002_9BACL|nr:hypothetical protein GCM10010912_05460 [Paenibacillus albidus]
MLDNGHLAAPLLKQRNQGTEQRGFAAVFVAYDLADCRPVSLGHWGGYSCPGLPADPLIPVLRSALMSRS